MQDGLQAESPPFTYLYGTSTDGVDSFIRFQSLSPHRI